MTEEDHDEEGDHDEHSHHPHDEETPATGRSTAPQSPYTLREVGIGFAVLAAGLVVAFGLPLAFTF